MINFFRYSVFKVLKKRLIFSPRKSTLGTPLRRLPGTRHVLLYPQAVSSAIRDQEQFHAPNLSSLMRLSYSRSTCRSCPRRARAKHIFLCARLRFINKSGSRLLFHTVSSIVPSAVQVLTVVFGMRTGVAPARIATRQT